MTHIPGTWTCDGCDEQVSEQEMITLSTSGGFELTRRHEHPYRAGYIGHYHEDCWYEVQHEIHVLAKGGERDPLETIPVAEDYEIMSRREGHRMPAGRRFGEATAELRDVLREVAPRCVYALPRAGVTSLDDVARLSDEQLLALPGVGQKTVDALRRALAREDVGRA
jgi:hypothetical protein